MHENVHHSPVPLLLLLLLLPAIIFSLSPLVLHILSFSHFRSLFLFFTALKKNLLSSKYQVLLVGSLSFIQVRGNRFAKYQTMLDTRSYNANKKFHDFIYVRHCCCIKSVMKSIHFKMTQVRGTVTSKGANTGEGLKYLN